MRLEIGAGAAAGRAGGVLWSSAILAAISPLGAAFTSRLPAPAPAPLRPPRARRFPPLPPPLFLSSLASFAAFWSGRASLHLFGSAAPPPCLAGLPLRLSLSYALSPGVWLWPAPSAGDPPPPRFCGPCPFRVSPDHHLVIASVSLCLFTCLSGLCSLRPLKPPPRVYLPSSPGDSEVCGLNPPAFTPQRASSEG